MDTINVGGFCFIVCATAAISDDKCFHWYFFHKTCRLIDHCFGGGSQASKLLRINELNLHLARYNEEIASVLRNLLKKLIGVFRLWIEDVEKHSRNVHLESWRQLDDWWTDKVHDFYTIRNIEICSSMYYFVFRVCVVENMI